MPLTAAVKDGRTDRHNKGVLGPLVSKINLTSEFPKFASFTSFCSMQATKNNFEKTHINLFNNKIKIKIGEHSLHIKKNKTDKKNLHQNYLKMQGE